LKAGDLVKRVTHSSVIINKNSWDISEDTVFLVLRGLHEGNVFWSDRVISVGIVIDVINPSDGCVYRGLPAEDFVKVG